MENIFQGEIFYQQSSKTQLLYGIHFVLWSFSVYILLSGIASLMAGEKKLCFVPEQLTIWVKFGGLESDIWLQPQSGQGAWMVCFS